MTGKRRTDLAGRSAWIGEGPERCAFCLQGHSLEVEVRCVGCDRAGCPWCVMTVRETRETWCPECGPVPAPGERPR